MNIAIRVDASRHIGYGHIMRCVTLAEELRRQGAGVTFMCREDEGNLIDFIGQSGFNSRSLPSGISPEEDALLTSKLLTEGSGQTDCLIVDHYGLGLSWEKYVKPCAEKIMVIDDYVDREHMCDILLNQNYGVDASVYEGITPRGCRKLTGSSYVLLRDQFRAARKNISPCNGEVKKIFIFFGGADSTNETGKTIKAAQLLDRANLSFIVLVGGSNPYWKEIKALCGLLPNSVLYRQVYDLAPLMANADLAIGAGGSNTWERCCLGLPSMVTVLAENQRTFVERLDRDGIVLNMGWFEDVVPSTIAEMLEKLISDRTMIIGMSKRSMEIVDGEGTRRVTKDMMQKTNNIYTSKT